MEEDPSLNKKEDLNVSIDSMVQLEKEDQLEQQRLKWIVCRNLVDDLKPLFGNDMQSEALKKEFFVHLYTKYILKPSKHTDFDNYKNAMEKKVILQQKQSRFN